MARPSLLASFGYELNSENFDELLPESDWARLPPAFTSLGLNQQRSLLVLFDVYSDRLWDAVAHTGVRSLTESAWGHCVRDLLVHGPRRCK